MAIVESIIEIEGQRGILQILLVLKENGNMLYAHLYNNPGLINISNNTTAKRALDILLKHELISQRKEQGKKATYYCLTEKGRKFTRLVCTMQKILTE
jgi:predicted transcriptional regulator